jgi:hypothetical protein
MEVLLTGNAEHARDAFVFETLYEQVGDSSVGSHADAAYRSVSDETEVISPRRDDVLI